MSVQTNNGPWRPHDTLSNRLVLLRHERDLSQKEASFRTGVSYGVWQGMEIGRDTRSVDKAVAKIAAALGVDRDWLMWGGPLAGPGDPSSPTATTDRQVSAPTDQSFGDTAPYLLVA